MGQLMSRQLATALALLSAATLGITSCSSSEDSDSSGASGATATAGVSGSDVAIGGSNAGGANTGGANAGGTGSSSGGTQSGGQAADAGDAARGGEAGAIDAPPARLGFRGPLNTGPDPFATYYAGNYYLTSTQGSSLRLWKSPTLGGLLTATAVTIWKDTDTTRNQEVWAPSVYLFDSHWYVYYTADDGTDDHHRLHVLESEGTDPLGPYHYKAKLVPKGAENFWAIDPVVLVQGDKKYVIWSGAGTEGHNVIYVAPMSDPWTISGARVFLATAGGCSEVREAPSTLQHAGTTFLTYSSCDTGKPDYQLWMLRIPASADPLVAKNWQQVQGAVFARSDTNGVWGPGSNDFFKSPDGSEDWLIYHGKNTTELTYGGRTTRAKKISWKADGSPDFGVPPNASDTLKLPAGDPGNGTFFLDDSGPLQADGNASIAFDAGWQSYKTCGNQCSLGNDHGSSQTGATATLTFTGTRVALLSVRDAGNGIAAFSLDDAAETTSDYYSAIRQGFQLTYLSPRVAYGEHQLRIRVTGQKNATSTGTAISLDRVEVDTR